MDIDQTIKHIQKLQVLAALRQVERDTNQLADRLVRLERRRWYANQLQAAQSYRAMLADGLAFVPIGTKTVVMRTNYEQK